MAYPSLFEDVERSLRPLRPRQSAAIEAIRQAVKEGHRRIVLQAPTGFGKTLTAAHLIASSLAKGNRPLFTCPAITLIDQTLRAFEREGIRDIGVIQAKHERTDWSAAVQIASVQTLIRRPLPECHFLLIDEAHINFDALNQRLDCDEWKDKIAIGLTATPWAKGMGHRWTKLIIAATVQDLINEGYLSSFVVYAPADDREPDLSGVRTVAGDFEEKGASAVMSDAVLVADVVKTWKERAQGLSTFLFAVDRAHAKSLQEEFEKASVPCGYIDAYTEREQRTAIFQKMRRGEYSVIASVGCLDDKTEILTTDGWVGVGGITKQHRVAAWWNGFVEFTHPLGIISAFRKEKERMVSVVGTGINIRVTDDHKMLWSKTRGRKYDFTLAQDCVGQDGFIPVTGMAEPARFIVHSDHSEVERSRKHNQVYAYMKRGKDKGEAKLLAEDYRSRFSEQCALRPPEHLSLDDCRFVGFWLGDGGRTGSSVILSQSAANHGVVEWVDSLLKRMKIDSRRRVVPPAGRRVNDTFVWFVPWGRGGCSQKRRGVSYLDDYLDKSGSELYWGLNQEQVLALLDGFRMADGNHGKDGGGSQRGKYIVGANRQIFDFLQAICAVRGIRTSLSSKTCRSTVMYSLSYRVADYHQLEVNRLQFEEPKREHIWCVQSTTGAIIIRREGKVAVVGNCLTTGVDEDVRCIIDAAPTKSEIRHVQKIGRGLRTADGKDKLLILDHAGNTLRLGMVTDIHHEHLDTHKPGERGDPYSGDRPAPKPRKCHECHSLIPPGRKSCPICGAAVAPPKSHVQVRDGELVLMSPDGNHEKRKDQKPPENKQQWYSELLGLARERGHSDGWAAHRFKEKFKEWPSRLAKTPVSPGPKILAFDKYCRIRYAKSKQRQVSSQPAAEPYSGEF